VTQEALFRGIAQARPGNRTGDIGYAVQRYAETQGSRGSGTAWTMA